MARGSQSVKHRRGREGAALVESCLVIIFMSLLLFGVIQVSRAYAAREILDYAAMCGARAETVGFNQFMTYKVTRVGSIPNAGNLVNPSTSMSGARGTWWGTTDPGHLWDMAVRSTPRSPARNVELSRIPLYLGVDYINRLSAVLDYEDWRTISHPSLQQSDDSVRVSLGQRFPLTMPFLRAFYADDELRLRSSARMEHHASLYLE